MKQNSKNVGVIVLVLIILAGAVAAIAINGLSKVDDEMNINLDVVEYFTSETRDKVIREWGQPIEGFEPFMFMEVYPGLEAEDFDNVESILGIYKEENGEVIYVETDQQMHSAARAITDEGMLTLLDNLARRLNMDIETSNDVDDLLEILEQTEDSNGGDVSFIDIRKGSYGEISERQTRIIKTEEEWKELWDEMFTGTVVPKLSGDRMIIAVFMGEKSTGGYGTEITKITETDDKLIVYVKETSPGSGCIVTQAFTQPFHIIETEITDKSVDFVYDKETSDCE